MTGTKLENMQKVVVTAPLHTESASLSEVAQMLELPSESQRQPDLQYFSAIFVSSGMNKNGAVFMGSELVKARESVAAKAVDIEHDEQSVIGHITQAAFMERSGKMFDPEDVSRNKSLEDMDKMEMDIAISGIVYKTRFPDIAVEISEGEWMVSMEAFFRDYDVKIGDLIVPRDQAEELGYDKLVGQVVQVKKGDKELGFHLVGRVLRDIIFSGVGIVKNPANERSLILESASLNNYISENKENASIINLADIETLELKEEKVEKEQASGKEELSSLVREIVKEELGLSLSDIEEKLKKEEAGIPLNYKNPGTCVHYKKYVAHIPGPGDDTLPEPETDLSQYPLTTQPGGDTYPPGTEIVGEHYCNLFERECAARPGDATLPTCWRNVFARTVREEITSHEEILHRRRLDEGLVTLQALIQDARKYIQ